MKRKGFVKTSVLGFRSYCWYFLYMLENCWMKSWINL